jgi:hypothetical protein
MTQTSLLVVRGTKDPNAEDPTYTCLAHEKNGGRYALIEVFDNNVSKRTIYQGSDRQTVEKFADTFRGTVYVDKRDDDRLLDFTPPTNALEMNIGEIARPRSDIELADLHKSHAFTAHALRTEGLSNDTFRGAANRLDLLSAYDVTEADGFTQYRGGVKDDLGRVAELSHVVPKTEEWRALLERVHRGLDHIQKNHLKVGQSIDEIDRQFMTFMNDDDHVYGSPVHLTGFETHHDYRGTDMRTLQKYDFIVLGTVASLNGETAVVYRSGHAILDESEPPEAPHEPRKDSVRSTSVPSTPARVAPPPQYQGVSSEIHDMMWS